MNDEDGNEVPGDFYRDCSKMGSKILARWEPTVYPPNLWPNGLIRTSGRFKLCL